MRIVILIPKLHAGSELALNKLMQRKDLEIIGIVRSDISVFTQKYWRYIKYGIRRAGLFYAILIALIIILEIIGVALAGLLYWNRRRRWRTINQLVKKHNLKLLDTNSINSQETIKILKSWKPDVLVSLSFDQILKKKIIELPKMAALNMHPGILPRYKGIWPEFWKLHNKEKFAGVTIHHMSEKIDEGEIIAQMTYPIKKEDTKLSLALKSARHGANLLGKTLLKLKKGKKIKPLKPKGKPKTYSLPSRKHFIKFFKKGKKLFSHLTFWKEFRKKV